MKNHHLRRISGNEGTFEENNSLLARLSVIDLELMAPHLQKISLLKGQVLFEPGEDVEHCYFPAKGCMLSLVIHPPEGKSIEVANIGFEGALGGIVSAGYKPAFTRAVVQIAGDGRRISLDRLDALKGRSPAIRDLFTRYADALLAQVLQSVACNALHSLEERCCRWLLMARESMGASDVAVTHELLAEMLGVQRTYVTAIVRGLQSRGIIKLQRGLIRIEEPAGLRGLACGCYDDVQRHFSCVLPPIRDLRGGLSP